MTLVSADGRFGGPTKVALDLCAEQRRRGQDSSVYGGAAGFDDLPREFGGVPVVLAPTWSLVPKLGFAALVAPGLTRMATKGLTGHEVFHVHLARDLVTLPVAIELRRRGLPYVIQTHGMIDASERRLAGLIDRLMTRRAVSGATSAFVLTHEEQTEIRRLSRGQTNALILENGVPDPSGTSDDVDRLGALFLGRLHPRKGAALFAAAAGHLAADHPAGTFRIAGPDEGDLQNVRHALRGRAGGERVHLVGPVQPDAVTTVMNEAAVFVQPAHDEPFGMTILEAMSVGTPPILHVTSALAPLVTAARAGWTFDTEEDLTRLLADLLADETRTKAAGHNARELVAERFSVRAVVDRLEGLYPVVA
ncbi:glycosyltransferase [Curtobacterium sp. MCBA15_004]|uniref:glycosyltransferase n=1 Tax=unclassified Curtobacterium TaxID=257496 RepID=UPI00158718DE|nr:glycosyltransferase [Curtobacterium sp. MCBA15_004]WIA97411.1 glycosyltransferase [Curtobacterium sp. MCBA15_004]